VPAQKLINATDDAELRLIIAAHLAMANFLASFLGSVVFVLSFGGASLDIVAQRCSILR
jgi:hypothetical protein